MAGRRKGFGGENFYGTVWKSKIEKAGWLGLTWSDQGVNMQQKTTGRMEKRRLDNSEVPSAV